MTFREYMEGASRTIPRELGDADLLADAALGLCGEAGEICEATEGEARDDEIGDGWWYVAAAYHALDLEPDSVRDDREGDRRRLFRAASHVAEHAKKVRYHREPIASHRDALVTGLRAYASALSAATDTPDVQIWQNNLEKLHERYPDGFAPGTSE